MSSLAGEDDSVEVAQPADRRTAIADAFGALEDSSTDQNVSRETKPERTRDESGKFIPKTSAGGLPAMPKAGAEVSAASAPVTEPPVWDRPPKSWKPETHELWKSADPRLREYAYQREEQMRAGVEPLLPKAQLADAINKVAEPYMNTIRGLGVDLPRAVGGLMQADHQLRTLPYEQKLQYATSLLRGYGIDISQGVPAQQPAPDQNYYALQNELNTVRGEINSWKQQQEAIQDAAALADINAFAPTVEHFEEAKETMIDLLQKGFAKDIPDAYNKAIRLNDDLFQAQQQSKQAETAKAQIVAKNTAAVRAKTAAVSLKGSTPGASKSTNAQTRREVIAEGLDNLDSHF